MLYEEFFLTLTLPGEFHVSSYEAAMKEIQERWNKIMVILRKKGIIILGIKKIHLHENETPHIHATLYFKPEYEDIVREVVFSVFINDKNREDKAFQKTDNNKFVIQYLFKDFCRQYDEEICKIRFIGLRRNISSVWDNFDKKNYGNPTLSYLSNNRLFKARRLLDVEKNEENILFLLRAFAEPSLNEISKWHINLKHLTLTDEWRTLRIADLQSCIHGRQNILPKTRRTSFVNPEKWQFSNVFSILVKGNQEGAIHTFSPLRECVDRRFLRTRAELALCRARPPPKPSDTNDRFRIISGEQEVLRRPV